MQQLQMVFESMRENKKELKGLKQMYRDALNETDEHQNLTEKIAEMRAQKRAIEERVKSQMGRAYEKIETLTEEIKVQKIMLSDIAMTTLMDGKTVEVSDEFGNHYEPDYKVNFKKSNEILKK